MKHEQYYNTRTGTKTTEAIAANCSRLNIYFLIQTQRMARLKFPTRLEARHPQMVNKMASSAAGGAQVYLAPSPVRKYETEMKIM